VPPVPSVSAGGTRAGGTAGTSVGRPVRKSSRPLARRPWDARSYNADVARWIDLNADVGESLGPWPMGSDQSLIPLVSSVNVACGAHAGDPVTMRRTIRLALTAGASVGAHPGYPDLEGFGRRAMALSPAEIEATVLYQVAAVAGVTLAEGGRLHHVKPHGALYHRVAADPAAAAAFVDAVVSLDRSLRIVGPDGSALLAAAAAAGLPALAEGFCDRVYEPDGRLRSRDLPGALHSSPAAAAAQAVSIVLDGRASAADGSSVEVRAGTLCIHGDTPSAVEVAAAVRAALAEAGIGVRSPEG
jgi:5-oxoprolinase (ATP-hydrolysing) subunit A